MAVILGGGGLITRHNDGELEVLIVHRPKHLDWSLPAGKLDPGETLAECALREVYEETGYVCELGRELAGLREGETAPEGQVGMDAAGSFQLTGKWTHLHRIGSSKAEWMARHLHRIA